MTFGLCRPKLGSMTIHLKPETEALIQEDLEAYASASDFVEQAVALLHEQKVWLRENRSDIAAKIEEGYASALRGDLVDGEDSMARREARKSAWMCQRRI